MDIIECKIRELLCVKSPNEEWVKKTVRAVQGLHILFGIEIRPENITKRRINADQLWIVDEEELDFSYAKSILGKHSVDTLYPVLVLECADELALYMGSVRTLLFWKLTGSIECIVVKNENFEKSIFWKSRKATLNCYLDNGY